MGWLLLFYPWARCSYYESDQKKDGEDEGVSTPIKGPYLDQLTTTVFGDSRLKVASN